MQPPSSQQPQHKSPEDSLADSLQKLTISNSIDKQLLISHIESALSKIKEETALTLIPAEALQEKQYTDMLQMLETHQKESIKNLEAKPVPNQAAELALVKEAKSHFCSLLCVLLIEIQKIELKEICKEFGLVQTDENLIDGTIGALQKAALDTSNDDLEQYAYCLTETIQKQATVFRGFLELRAETIPYYSDAAPSVAQDSGVAAIGIAHSTHFRGEPGESKTYKVRDLVLDEGICLGMCFDFISRKLAAKPEEIPDILMQPDAHSRFVQASHLLLRSMPTPKELKKKIADFQKEVQQNPNVQLYEKCVKANEILLEFEKYEGQDQDRLLVLSHLKRCENGQNAQNLQFILNDFLTLLRRREKHLCPAESQTPIDDKSLAKLDLAAHTHYKQASGNNKLSISEFIEQLDHFKALQKNGGDVILFLTGASSHAIYCSFKAPYQIRDPRVPGCVLEATDFENFKILFTLWATTCPDLVAINSVIEFSKAKKK